MLSFMVMWYSSLFFYSSTAGKTQNCTESYIFKDSKSARELQWFFPQIHWVYWSDKYIPWEIPFSINDRLPFWYMISFVVIVLQTFSTFDFLSIAVGI